MVDARLPARWLTSAEIDALPDKAWRVFTFALMWSNENHTNGIIPLRALRFLHPDGVDADTLRTLRDAGLLVPSTEGALVIPDWTTRMGQETAEAILSRLEQNRLRQQRHRDSKRPIPEPVTRDVTRDVTRTPEERRGEARRGEDKTS